MIKIDVSDILAPDSEDLIEASFSVSPVSDGTCADNDCEVFVNEATLDDLYVNDLRLSRTEAIRDYGLMAIASLEETIAENIDNYRYEAYYA